MDARNCGNKRVGDLRGITITCRDVFVILRCALSGTALAHLLAIASSQIHNRHLIQLTRAKDKDAFFHR